jgi:hypothetical protein
LPSKTDCIFRLEADEIRYDSNIFSEASSAVNSFIWFYYCNFLIDPKSILKLLILMLFSLVGSKYIHFRLETFSDFKIAESAFVFIDISSAPEPANQNTFFLF